MIVTADIVECMARLYDDGVKAFDFGMSPAQDNGICWAIVRVGNYQVLIFRGSVTWQDWARDLFTLMVPRRMGHPSGGMVEAGFALGMEEAYRHIKPLLRFPFYVGGHSLGGARACWFISRWDGDAPLLGGVLCGCPQVGDATFAKTLDRYHIDSLRNGVGRIGNHDPVPHVPLKIPPIWRFVTPRSPFITIDEKPANGPGFLGANYHNIKLYERGARKLPALERKLAA